MHLRAGRADTPGSPNQAASERTERIRRLNGALGRGEHADGSIYVTAGVHALGAQTVREALATVAAFDTFTKENDPHGENDFGAVTVRDVRLFFKIDYYDKARSCRDVGGNSRAALRASVAGPDQAAWSRAVGYDGIVIANDVSAPGLDLTREQLWRALAAEVVVDGEVVANPYTNWSEIDSALPDAEIEVFGPPPTSGTRDALVELVMEEGCAAPLENVDVSEDEAEAICATMCEDGRFIEAGENDNAIVQDLQANPAALGIFGFSFLDQNRDVVKGAAIGGVEPTFEAIAAGDYPVSRSLYLG